MGELTRLSNIKFARNEGTYKAPAPRICPICGNEVQPLRLPSGSYIARTCECERKIRREEKAKQEREAYVQELAERTYGWLGDAWTSKQYVQEMSAKTFKQYDMVRQEEYASLKATLAQLTRKIENLDDQDEKEILIERKKVNQKRFDEFPAARRSWTTAKEKAEAFANNPQGILMLYGPYGLGKTHLLAAICNSLRLRQQPVPSLFVTTPKFFSAFYDKMDTHSEWDLVQRAMTTPFLCFDDVDKAGPKEFRREIFYQIIDSRVAAHLPMAISTNNMEGLSDYIGEAAYSRLMDHGIPVKMLGADYRHNLLHK